MNLKSLFFSSIENSECTTPNEQLGHCIDLRQCNVLYDLIRKPNISLDEKNFLRRSQCAFHDIPWVTHLSTKDYSGHS